MRVAYIFICSTCERMILVHSHKLLSVRWGPGARQGPWRGARAPAGGPGGGAPGRLCIQHFSEPFKK